MNSNDAYCLVMPLLSWIRRETKGRKVKGKEVREEKKMRRKRKVEEGEFKGARMEEDKRSCLPRTSRKGRN